jgi:hypothetical protein
MHPGRGQNVLRLGKLCPLAYICVRHSRINQAEPPSFRFFLSDSGAWRGPMEIGKTRCQRVTMSLCFLQLGNLIPRYSTYSSPQHSFLKTPYSVLIEPANKSTIAIVPRKSLKLSGGFARRVPMRGFVWSNVQFAAGSTIAAMEPRERGRRQSGP